MSTEICYFIRRKKDNAYFQWINRLEITSRHENVCRWVTKMELAEKFKTSKEAFIKLLSYIRQDKKVDITMFEIVKAKKLYKEECINNPAPSSYDLHMAGYVMGSSVGLNPEKDEREQIEHYISKTFGLLPKSFEYSIELNTMLKDKKKQYIYSIVHLKNIIW